MKRNKMTYKEMVAEFGVEFADAVLEEEYNQYIASHEPTPAQVIDFDDCPFDFEDDYYEGWDLNI